MNSRQTLFENTGNHKRFGQRSHNHNKVKYDHPGGCSPEKDSLG